MALQRSCRTESVVPDACLPPRLWGRVVMDLDDEEDGARLCQPIRRVARLGQRGGPYFTRGVGVLRCAAGGLYQSMRQVVDLDEEAAVGLHQPTPCVAGPTYVSVCADTLLDEDSASDVAPTELEVSFDEDDMLSLPFHGEKFHVTWAVPVCVVICIEPAGRGKPVPVRAMWPRPMPPRGTLQYVRPPDEDSEDEDSDDQEFVPWAEPFFGGEQPYYDNREALESSRD